MAMMPNPQMAGGMMPPGMPDPALMGGSPPMPLPKMTRHKKHGKKRRHGGKKKRSR